MRRDDVRRTLIAYDVPNDRRRTKLAKLLESFGDRIQFSVFIVDIAPARLLRLKDEISDLIIRKEDSILFCDLGRLSDLDRKRFSFLGLEREVTSNESLII